jgi:uncharacterized protein
MLIQHLRLFVAAATAAMLATTSPASAQLYGLGTGKQGFYTYSAAAAIAKVASDNGLALRVQPFGGTSASVPAINAKEVEFGLANELETHYAVTGTVIYKGKQQPDVRVVAVLTSFHSVMFVKKDSPIKTLADLKGKRVPSDYVSQKIITVLTQGTLANAGIGYKDVKKVPVPNVVGGANALAEGKADTFMFALGAGKVTETDAKVGGIRVLPLDPSPEAMKRVRQYIPVGYAAQLKPRKGLIGILEPTYVLSYDYLVLASSKTSADAVYKLAKIMHDHKADLAAAFKPLAGFDPKRMVKDMAPVKFHDGAIKYYKEIGAWPPKSSS